MYMYWSVASFMPSDVISSTVRCAVGLKVVVCEWRSGVVEKEPRSEINRGAVEVEF